MAYESWHGDPFVTSDNRHFVDCVVIGAGVIGLACARRLALSGIEVLILESGTRIGEGISSRNSEVIHAGIYYPSNSLKAELCVKGKKMLYTYLQTRGITHKKVGKIIVATESEETSYLQNLEEQAKRNGVDDLVLLNKKDLRELEPALEGIAGLFSPSTGILDSHALMLSYLGEAEQHGAMLAVQSCVKKVNLQNGIFQLEVEIVSQDSIENMTLKSKKIINATGLSASEVARVFSFFPKQKVPKTYFCKGNYFIYRKPSPFKHLIYPVPNLAGLGIHSTLDLDGAIRFGPDVEWMPESEAKDLNYQVSLDRKTSFYTAIKRYWPSVVLNDLQPGYVGVRPKLVGPNEKPHDFCIQGPKEHQISGLVHLYGIESPGLTASLAIGDYVAELLQV